MKKIISTLLISCFLTLNVFAGGKIQGADVKSEAELIAAGATKAQMISDAKIYVTANGLNDKLSTVISSGALGLNSWATTVSYSVGYTVINSAKIYQCAIAHVAGVFATDLAASKWTLLSVPDLATATGILSIPKGGTGSTTQNFVDLTTAQTVAGIKTFSSTIVGSVNGNAATVTTNADLTGVITSAGNVTSIGAQTGTGSTFVTSVSPTITTPTFSGTAVGSISGNAATVTTNANLTGDVTSVGNATTLGNAPVIAKVLTGFSAAAGVVAATDSILVAFNKVVGNQTPITSPLAALSVDWSILKTSGGLYTKALSANSIFTFANLSAGQTIIIRLTNTASNYTVTWPTVKWSGATVPTQTIGAKSDVYTFIYDGTDIYGSAVQNF